MPERFPEGFLWGSATSSHQVEGGNTANDWWAWEQQPGHIRDGTTSGDAAGWWAGKAEADLRAAAAMGHNAHRMSLEWSRLEPEPGRFDDAAFERYRQILGTMRERGLTPLVTVNHFTLPMWAADRGSWLDPELVLRFEAYARECGRRLGDLVELWATLNEPNVMAFFGYAGTRWPPGRGELVAFARAMVHLMQAHAAGYEALHATAKRPSVGIVLNFPRFEPARPHHPLDRAVAKAQDWAMAGSLLRALQTGRLEPPTALPGRRIDGLAKSIDWFGLNFYGRFEVRFDVTATADLFGRHVQSPTTATEWTDWGQAHAPSLTAQLLRLRQLEVPIYITENGLFDNDDDQRPQFIVDHVRAIHRAIESGVDVRGYFHWSLVDNFEWAEGWSAHFGLLELDRTTLQRTPRSSAEVYGEICRNNGL
jgi:beta-glucosidase